MKRLGLIIILIGFAFSAIHAQTEQQNTLETEKTDVASPEMVLSEDSLSVPLASPVSFSNQLRPFGMYGITPFDYNFATWELHKGFKPKQMDTVGSRIRTRFRVHVCRSGK